MEIRHVKHTRCLHAAPEPASNGHFVEHNCGCMILLSENEIWTSS